MMGAEEQQQQQTLKLDSDSLSSNSFSTYKSTFTSLSSDSHHPLSDPLFSPPSPQSLPPPSYSDIVISPLHTESHELNESNGDDTENAKNNAIQQPELRVSESPIEYLKISVSKPQKEVEASNSIVPGGNKYFTYLITSTTNILEHGGSEFVVRRRFKDVVTLSDRLSEVYRGYFIPSRPDKSVVESQVMQKQEFVEQRRVALEKYLRRLAGHPVIRKSDELRVFLQVQGKLPLPTSTDVASRMLDGAVNLPKQLFGDSSSVIAPQEAVQPAKGGRDLLRIFKELKQSVSNDWGGSKRQVEDDDKEFVEKKERLNVLEVQLGNASQQAEALVKAQQDMGETMGELGLAFLKLMKFENQEASYNTQRARAADMKNVATATVKASRLYRELNAQTVKHLVILPDPWK
ncbi:hypothetical protein AgCh_036067 [Apium graveolens]